MLQRVIAVLVPGLVFATPGLAATLRVPSIYATIQAALNAASPGDTVLVAPGTYTGAGNRDLSFRGKDVVLRSEAGASATVVDAQASSSGNCLAGELHRVCVLRAGEGPAARIEGFTFTSGRSDDGAGLVCDGASPTVIDCVFSRNRACTGGGAIQLKNGASPFISGCQFLHNRTEGDGAAIRADNTCNPVLTDCVFDQNDACCATTNYGGAISSDG